MIQRKTILVIESNKLNKMVINELIKNDYKPMNTSDAQEAKAKAKVFINQFCAILYSPGTFNDECKEFITLCVEQKYTNTVPLIVLLSKALCEEYAHSCFELGATEVVEMPFDPVYLQSKLSALSKLYNRDFAHQYYENNSDKLVEARTNIIIRCLSNAFELIQFEPPQHITRVKGLTSIIATKFAEKYPEYNLSEEDVSYISQASAIHDVGKALVPTTILFKAGKLTKEEFDIMKTHTTKGVEYLESLGIDHSHKFFQYCHDICKYHHERWDGRGYPEQLAEDKIPVAAQIVSIVDVYDSLISERVYKAAIPYEKAVAMIREGQCGLFPPKVIAAFDDVEADFDNYLKELLAKPKM